MSSGEGGVTAWALEYECGCVREWGERDGFAGLFLTESCPGHERSANCPGCGMLMVAPHGTLPDADADGYCPNCQRERGPSEYAENKEQG